MPLLVQSSRPIVTRLEYVRALDRDAFDQYGRIVSWAFASPQVETTTWLETGGVDNVRVLRADGRVVAGLLLIPMGQFFGGRAVPMMGIAGVGVAAELRGRGLAFRLLCETLAELHDSEYGLSTLYPATNTLYRKAGWELAGSHYRITLDAQSVGVSDHAGELREATEADFETIATLYRDGARQQPGYLDRGAYVWSRVKQPRGQPARATLLCFDGQAEGYVFLTQTPLPSGMQDLRVTDHAVTSPRAARRLLSFLADHRSVGHELHLTGGASGPLLWQLPEKSAKVTLYEHWMTRICNVQAALSGRGYPAGAKLTLNFEVTDAVVAKNSGRFRLDIDDGSAHVSPGGSGRLAITAGGLASLYTGFMSPHSLARTGMLSGDERSLAQAATAFASELPTLPDFF